MAKTAKKTTKATEKASKTTKKAVAEKEVKKGKKAAPVVEKAAPKGKKGKKAAAPSKFTPKELCLMILIKGLDHAKESLTREAVLEFVHEIGYPQFNMRNAGFAKLIDENFPKVKERAERGAVKLLEKRGFDLETIKNAVLAFGSAIEEAEEAEDDDDEDDEEEEAPKKSKKSSAATPSKKKAGRPKKK